MNQAYLWEKLGGEIQVALSDPDVTEVIVNPDGKRIDENNITEYNQIGLLADDDTRKE